MRLEKIWKKLKANKVIYLFSLLDTLSQAASIELIYLIKGESATFKLSLIVFLSNLAWRQARSWYHSVSLFKFKVFTIYFSFTGFLSGDLELHLCTTTNCSTQLYDNSVDCLKGTVVYHLIDFGRWSFRKPRSFQNFLGKTTLLHCIRTVFADRRTFKKVKFHNIENRKKNKKTLQNISIPVVIYPIPQKM